jgi:hypothetical protein
VSQLCVNTLPATKFTLITDGIQFGSLKVNISCKKRREDIIWKKWPWVCDNNNAGQFAKRKVFLTVSPVSGWKLFSCLSFHTLVRILHKNDCLI